jgi:hypothetical protein
MSLKRAEMISENHPIEDEFDSERWRIPLRLACLDKDGCPRIVSLWYQYRAGSYFCATHKNAWIVNQLTNNPNIGFEIASNEPPYYGIRGSGRASLYPMDNASLLEDLLLRYVGTLDSELAAFLLARKDSELVIKIDPIKESRWNYKKRMQGSL